MRILSIVLALVLTCSAFGQDSSPPPPIQMPASPINWPELLTLISGIVVYVIKAVTDYLQSKQTQALQAKKIVATDANTEAMIKFHAAMLTEQTSHNAQMRTIASRNVPVQPPTKV